MSKLSNNFSDSSGPSIFFTRQLPAAAETRRFVTDAFEQRCWRWTVHNTGPHKIRPTKECPPEARTSFNFKGHCLPLCNIKEMALKTMLFESLKDPPLASPIRLLCSKSGSSLRACPNCYPVWSGQKRPQLPQRLHDVRDSKANQSLLHQAFTDEHFWIFSVGVQKLWSHTLPYMGLAPLRQPLAGTCLYKKTAVCTALTCLLRTMPSAQLSKVALVPTLIFELKWFTVGLLEACCGILHVEDHHTRILCTCI